MADYAMANGDMADDHDDYDGHPGEMSIDLRMSPENEAGVYSDGAVVFHSPHGFRLDFYQQEHTGEPNLLSGLVVARVHMSPLMFQQLLEAIQTNWQNYAAKALPPT